MLAIKLTSVFAVTLLVLFITTENEVNAAPEPCKDIMSYVYMGFKKPEKNIQLKDKEKMEKDKKKDLLHKLEKMFGSMLREALQLEVEETTQKPRGAVEDLLTSYTNYINFLTRLWNL